MEDNNKKQTTSDSNTQSLQTNVDGKEGEVKKKKGKEKESNPKEDASFEDSEAESFEETD